MQKTARDRAVAEASPLFRERLSPSLWVLVSAAVVAPMAALVFAPIDTSVALVAGAIAGVLFVALLIAGSPVATTGADAQNARGPGLDPRAWHVIRGGIDGVVVVEVTDPDDPTPEWVVSSRTPDRLAAAIRRAQATPSTPGR